MQVLHAVILGNGEPLVILHGLFGMGDNWKSLALRFAENFEVHLVDARNHGRSFHTDEFSYDLMVEDLLYYLDDKSLEKVNIIGHSMGGKTAMLFAIKYPERVNKLIVADIAPKYYPPHHQFILKALQAVDFDKVKSRKEIDEVLSKHINEFAIRQFLLKNVYRKTKEEFAYRFHLKSLIKNIENVGDAFSHHGVFKGETLFLKGENSGYISKDDIHLIKQHFPNSHIITIKKAGHWLHAENPNDFYQNVINFVKAKQLKK